MIIVTPFLTIYLRSVESFTTKADLIKKNLILSSKRKKPCELWRYRWRHTSQKCKNKAWDNDSSVWKQDYIYVSEVGLDNLWCKMSNFSILCRLMYNGGHMTDVIPQYLHKKFKIYKMWVPGGLLPSECAIFLRNIDCGIDPLQKMNQIS